MRAQRPRETAAADAIAAEPTAPDRKMQRRAEAAERARLAELRKPLQRKLADVEAELKALEAEKQELEAWLASEDAYAENNKERLLIVLERQGDLGWRLARAESAWLELQGALEQIG